MTRVHSRLDVRNVESVAIIVRDALCALQNNTTVLLLMHSDLVRFYNINTYEPIRI